MKPINPPTYFVQHLLYALAMCLATLGIILGTKMLTFFPATWGYLSQGNLSEPIILGIIPTFNAALFLCYLCLYLNFEFYGFKTAFYGTLSVGSLIVVLFFIFKFYPDYGLNASENTGDQTIKDLISMSEFKAVKMLLSVGSSFFVSFVFAAAIKKLTRNYFMFLRFPLASICGFALFAVVVTHFEHQDILDPYLFAVYAATPAAQFLALIVASLIPLYFLRLIFGMFRGKVRVPDSEDEPQSGRSKKSMFGASNPDDVLPPPPEDEPAPKKDEVEHTVSERIHIDEIK